MTAKETIYPELFKRVSKHVKSYRDDLTKHDKEVITANPRLPFLHLTRESGTSITMLWNADTYPKKDQYVKYLFGTANRDHILTDHCGMFVHWFTVLPQIAIHYFDGKKLKKITKLQGEQILSAYMQKIRQEWQTLDAKDIYVITG